MYRINAGEFRHKIKILKYIPNVNEDNIPINQEIVLFETKARVLNISSKEKILADGKSYINIKRFFIKYRKGFDITNKDKIYFNGKKYKISYISNVEEKNIYIEIVGEMIQ